MTKKINDEVLDISALKEMTVTKLKIPNFDNTGYLTVRVQQPRLMALAKEGEIPNHLLGIASEMITGQATKSTTKPKAMLEKTSQMLELYARVCLVEPTYDEFKDYITDRQGDAIFAFAMGQVSELDSFRENSKDDTGNTDEQEVQEKA